MKELLTNPYSFDAYKIGRDSQGRAVIDAKIMTTGKLRYVTVDGDEYYGNITLDALNKAVPTAKMKPITVKHPPDMISPSDVTKYQEGISADNYRVEEIDGKPWLIGPVILQSDRAIGTAESGKLGVSAGYYRDAIPTDVDGVYNFENIDINHIAIGCDNPRAEGAGLSLDEAEDDSARIYSFAKQQTPKKQEVIMKQKLNAVKVGEFSLDEAPIKYDEAGEGTEQAISTLAERETKLVTRLEEVQISMDEAEEVHKKELGDATGEVKALTAKVEELEKENENKISLDEVDAMAEERADVKAELAAREIDVNFKTIKEGKKLVVEHDFPNQSFDESEIEGAYKTRNVDKKDLAERKKSEKALESATSMDSGDKVSVSQLTIAAIKKNKQLQKRRVS